MKKHLIIALGALAIFSACKKDNTTDTNCDGTSYTYTTDVKAIFDKNCASAGCHSSSSKSAGINLSTYEGSKAANSSSVIGSINHKSGYNSMPEGASKLSDSDIQTITCWYNSGTPN